MFIQYTNSVKPVSPWDLIALFSQFIVSARPGPGCQMCLVVWICSLPLLGNPNESLKPMTKEMGKFSFIFTLDRPLFRLFKFKCARFG